MKTVKVCKRRVKRLGVTPNFIVAMCCNDQPFRVKLTEGRLPLDARAVGASYDPLRNAYWVFVHSAEFEQVPENEVPPELPLVTFERVSA